MFLVHLTNHDVRRFYSEKAEAFSYARTCGYENSVWLVTNRSPENPCGDMHLLATWKTFQGWREIPSPVTYIAKRS